MNLFCDYFLLPASPALALVITGVVLLALECLPGNAIRPLKLPVALLGTLTSGACTWWIWSSWPVPFNSAPLLHGDPYLLGFVGSFRLDPMSLAFFAAIALFTFLGLVFMHAHFQDEEIRSEVLMLTLFIASGMMLLVSADSLLMVFLALELLSLPTYVLVGIHRRDKNSSEAALKYFLFGSFATVLLVFAIALLYGQYATLSIPKITAALAAAGSDPQGQVLVMGSLALFLIAVGFKVGVVPFHMWVPDAYQGAPTAVTGYMGSAIKLAGFGLTLRLLWGIFLPLAAQWSDLLGWIAVLTMFVGNIAALVQDNLKRVFAYSSISHAGYLMLAVSAVPAHAAPSMLSIYFYLLIYGLMFLGLFGVLATVEDTTKSTDIHQFSGFGFTHPMLGACLAIFALSGAGIPPTAGFFAKYFIFLDAVHYGKTLMVLLAVISSVIGAYYYLRVVVFLYMKEARDRITLPSRSRLAYACIMVCALSILYFAVAPLGMHPMAR